MKTTLSLIGETTYSLTRSLLDISSHSLPTAQTNLT